MVKKIIFTREQAPDSAWLEKIRQSGFETHHVPLIRCQSLPLPEAVQVILPEADWVFFTSAVAVEAFRSGHLPPPVGDICEHGPDGMLILGVDENQELAVGVIEGVHGVLLRFMDRSRRIA